jgi:hypothetical protein
MKSMKNILAGLFMLLFVNISTIRAQETDTLKLRDYLNMSLADIVKIIINVSPLMPTELFNDPSSLTQLDSDPNVNIVK